MVAARQGKAMRADRRRLVEELVAMYRRGYFPMADPQAEVVYLCDASPRGLMPLSAPEGLRIPRRLRRTLRQGRFEITSDVAFERVIRSCGEPRTPRPQSESVSAETWIDENIVHAYCVLHRAGLAHSVEAWAEHEGRRQLVGGIYGVTIGRLFSGESMFCRPELGGTDASKVCLIHAAMHAARRGFELFDTQFLNPHLEQFGAYEVPREEYQRRLDHAVERHASWAPFEPWRTVEALGG